MINSSNDQSHKYFNNCDLRIIYIIWVWTIRFFFLSHPIDLILDSFESVHKKRFNYTSMWREVTVCLSLNQGTLLISEKLFVQINL